VRVIAFIATTGNNNFSLVCSFSLGVTKYVYGTPITDWVQYTPSFNSGFSVGTGGSAFNKWYWRRVGDSIQIRGGFKFGTSGFSMGSGDFQASLPSGLSFDSSKLTWQVDRIGVFDTHDGNQTNMREVGAVYVPGTSNTFRFIQRRVDNTSGAVNANFPFTWAADDELYCRIEAPIQGWSSSVKMSDGYDGREIAASYRNDSGGTVASGALTFIDFNTQRYDFTNSVVGAGNGHSTNWQNTWRYIVPVSGLYSVKTNVTLFFPANTLSSLFGAICVNGNQIIRGTRSYYTTPNVTEPRGMVIAGDLYLKAGDAISVGVLQDSGAARTIENGTPTTISIHRISSPQTIAMGEVVAARYRTSSGQSIPQGTNTIVNFNTKDYDTHNAVTTGSNWKFTAPVAGIYNVTSCIMYNTFSITNTGQFIIDVYKNNAVAAGLDKLVFGTYASNSYLSVCGSTNIELKAGDTIDVRVFQDTGASRSLWVDTNYVWVSIHKIS
jgi:hypothetical protein